jgi:hypothetical protein
MMLPIAGSMNENQLISITFLGVKSIPRLVEALDQRIEKFNSILKAEGGDKISPKERVLRIEERKTQVKYLYRLAFFLNMCLYAPSPETVRILTDVNIGRKLSEFLKNIDPKLKHKNVHFALTKFFTTLCQTEVPGLKSLIIDFEYPLELFKKNIRRYNVISSQYSSQF